MLAQTHTPRHFPRPHYSRDRLAHKISRNHVTHKSPFQSPLFHGSYTITNSLTHKSPNDAPSIPLTHKSTNSPSHFLCAYTKPHHAPCNDVSDLGSVKSAGHEISHSRTVKTSGNASGNEVASFAVHQLPNQYPHTSTNGIADADAYPELHLLANVLSYPRTHADRYSLSDGASDVRSERPALLMLECTA